jgi:rhamnogalacturonan endolyase
VRFLATTLLLLLTTGYVPAAGERQIPGAGLRNSSGATLEPVRLTEDADVFTLANGFVTAKVKKGTADLISLRYQDLEVLGGGSGHPYGYWSHTPGRESRVANSVSINPSTNGGARAEVSVKGFYEGTALGQGPGGSAVADIEIRYALGRDDHGVYTYSIFQHKPGYPATSIGEARFCAKLNGRVFDYLTIDANRNRKMPSPEDWDKGTPLNMKEVRRLNTGIYAGQVEHKYDYSAVQFDIPAYGWSSTSRQVGLWFVNPSVEYLSGGATKVELTGHLDNNAGAAPTLLNYWRGSHYGGSSCVIAAGEAWTKVIGPFLIYCNAGASPDAMWKDALVQVGKEAKAWPYEWVSGVDYPHKDQRGLVTGQLVLNDLQASQARMTNLLVGLAAPDYSLRGGRGGAARIDWQLDAKHYEFWVRGDRQGRFAISQIRPGTYTLHAIADGVLGEYSKADVVVAPGQTVDLGRLDWQPVRYGRQLWDIGIPNRSAEEFRHGDHYWQWGLYYEYPKEFPRDVNFVIGKSDFHQDWNYCQPPRLEGDRVESTTWSIAFALNEAPRGKATLRLAITGSQTPRGIEVIVNGTPAGSTGPLLATGVMHRDGIRGYWCQRALPFAASLLKPGANVIKLHVAANNWTQGVLYDYLRLELDESAQP